MTDFQDINIHTYTQMVKYFPSCIYVEDYMNSTLEMIQFTDYLVNIMKNVFNIDECRAYPVRFKIYHEEDNSYILPLRQFIVLMILWVPLSKVWHFHMVDNTFVETRIFSKKVRTSLQNKIHNFLLYDCGVTLRETNALSHMTIWLLDRLATDFGLLVGTPVTASSLIIDAYEKDTRIRELMTHEFSESLQTSDLEKEIPKYYKMLMDVLREEHIQGQSIMPELIDGGSSIKQKQVEEMLISYGQVANINNVIMQYTLKGNGMTTGYSRPSDFRIAATNAITSLILNKSLMGKAGYTRRNEMFLALQRTLSRDVYDCGSIHPIQVHIESSLHLFQLNRRWYRFHEHDFYKQINASIDTDLIGKDIWIRSPITCALEDEICSVCYGGNSYLVSDIPNGACGFGAEEVFRPVEQGVLSNKHMRSTKAAKISYLGNFNKYFVYRNGVIYVAHDLPSDELENTYISIQQSDIVLQDFNDQSVPNPELASSTFQLVDDNDNEIETITIENTMFTKITKKFLSILAKNNFSVSLKSVSKIPLFILEISNNSISTTLGKISRLIGTSEILNFTASQALSQFIDLGWKSGVTPSSVQFEIILAIMISEYGHPEKRPNFKLPNVQYQFHSIKQKLDHHPSALLQISFENIKEKLKSSKLEQSNKLSQFDTMFFNDVPTDQLKEIRKNLKSMKSVPDIIKYAFGYQKDIT